MFNLTSSEQNSMDSAFDHDFKHTHAADANGKGKPSLSSMHAREKCKAAMESISSIHDEVIPSRSFNSDPIGKEHEDLPSSASLPASAPEAQRTPRLPLQSPHHALHTAGHVLDDGDKQRVCIHDASASMPLADDSTASTNTAFDSFAAYSSAMFEKTNVNALYETTAVMSSPQSCLESKEEDMHTKAINEAFKAKSMTSNSVVSSSLRSETALTANSDPLPLSHSQHIKTSMWSPFDAPDGKQDRDLAQANGSLQGSIKKHLAIICKGDARLRKDDACPGAGIASSSRQPTQESKEDFTHALLQELVSLKIQNKELENNVKELRAALGHLNHQQNISLSPSASSSIPSSNGARLIDDLHVESIHGTRHGNYRASPDQCFDASIERIPSTTHDIRSGVSSGPHAIALHGQPLVAHHNESHARTTSHNHPPSDNFHYQAVHTGHFGHLTPSPTSTTFPLSTGDCSRAERDNLDCSSGYSSARRGSAFSTASLGLYAENANLAAPFSGEYDRSTGQELQISAEILVGRVLSGRSQEPSVSLQHQLKCASVARRKEILQAMEPHLPRLAEDKHGNFLVQRAISTEESIAWKLCGHFTNLSLSQFGCHVVQMILQQGGSIRRVIAQELISERLYDTLTCRNSIHVWQQLLEVQWDNANMRRTIFSTINDAMRGKWARVAMLETGSIICQNIFESADADQKRECLDEVLEELCACAANQWGVWVVQHIIEHGEDAVRERAFRKLLEDPVRLSLSQFGQKAVMSALKSGSSVFIDGFISALCEREITSSSCAGSSAAAFSRRSVLVDVATAPAGLQIITQLITSVTDEQRDLIIKTVRRNSVFLKGTKAGLKVHQLCERARAYKGY